MENKNLTIVDLFIDILSKNKDIQSQNMVKRLKVFICIPECAEFLNVIIINAMGYKSQIKSTTVYKNSIRLWVTHKTEFLNEA